MELVLGFIVIALRVAALPVAGCAIYASDNREQVFGPAEPCQRMETADSDAPCQLKLSAPEGIDRGASQDRVYNASRLTEAPLTRLFEDAQTTSQWRMMGFSPVLNEHKQTPRANLQASAMHHMLALKRDNPLPQDAVLDESFELGLDSEQQCPKADEMDDFAEEYPLWGMPYATPGLADAEFKTLEHWLKAGARMALPAQLGADFQAEIDRWEAFLNGDSLKQQLMSRYLYEHWAVEGMTLSTLPQITYLNVESVSGDNDYYTILRNNAHSNISSMLAEGGTLEPEADTLTVVRNFIGSYPNAYWRVAEKDLPELVAQVAQLSDEASYAALMDRYGVRRTSPEFWQHSDKVMRAHHAADPLANALLDYSRLENR